MGEPAAVLLNEGQIAHHVHSLARRLAPWIDETTVVVPILTGAMWFAADLTRALARLGRYTSHDALWLSSYRGGQTGSGQCEVRATLQWPIEGRTALVVDEVIDTGVSLGEAARICRGSGACRIVTAVFACKPSPAARVMEPDFAAWEAPADFLVGYGMDLGGRFRELPWIGVSSPPD